MGSQPVLYYQGDGIYHVMRRQIPRWAVWTFVLFFERRCTSRT